MNVFELFGTIAIDHSEADRSLDKTGKNAKKLEDSLKKTFKRIGTYVAAAFSVREIVNFGKACTQVYADVAAEESAFAQVMGDYANTARDKLNAVATQTGIASTRMTSAMTSMTAKFMGLGYNVEDATTLATDGLMIAADAAAFWDMSLEDSMSHLNSFINGSYEAGEAIGLFANDSQMAAYAVAQGFVVDEKAWAQLDEATKQAIRLNFASAMQEASGVTGQAANEAGAYANVLGNLQEAWRQLLAVIGKPILEKIVLPAMQKLNEFLPVLTENVQKGIDWLTESFDKIAAYFSEVFTEDGLNMDALPKALKKMFRDLANGVSGLLRNFGQAVKNGWNNTVWPMIQNVFKAVFGVELPDWEEVKQQISDGWNDTVWPAVQNFFTKNFGIILPSWSEVATDISTGWSNVMAAVGDIFGAVFSIFTNDTDDEGTAWTDKIKSWFDGILAAIGNYFGVVLNIFTSNSDEEGTTWVNKIKSWFDGILTAIGDFFGVAFSIFTNNSDADGVTWADKIKNWFTGILAAVGDIFGAVFDIGLPDWQTLKTSISDGWNNTVWPAIKDFFEQALVIALPVWEDIKTGIVNGWNNTVLPALSGLFEKTFDVKPEDATGEEVGKKLRAWWDKVVAFIGDIFGAIFSVSTDDDTGVTTGTKIKNWWATVVKFVGNIFRGFFGVDPENPADVANNIIAWFEGVMTAIGDIFYALFGLKTSDTDSDGTAYTDKLKNWFTNLLASIGEFFVAVFGLNLPVWEDVKTKITNDWNNTVWPAIKDFFTKPFGIELPSWEELKTNISNGWNNTVWPAIQNFFTKPFGIILPPWGKLKTSISDGWNNTVWPAIQGFFTKVFSIELPDFSEIASKISAWWTNVMENVGNIFSAIFGITTDNSDTGISDTAATIKNWFDNVISAAGDVFSVVVSAIGGAISSARNAISSWWNRVKSGLNLTVTATVQAVYDGAQNQAAYKTGNGGSAASNTSAGTIGGAPMGALETIFEDRIPGFATGLDYVPYDNYLARLHQGEAVLTRNEADTWRNGGNAGGVEAVLGQMAALLQTIAQNTGADRPMVLDTGALVGQLAPGIDARLGTISDRKGRRN